MKYKLIKNRKLVQDEDFAGYNGENRAEKLEFEIPDALNDYAKKINFDLGTEKVSDILNQDNTYILKNNITQYKQVSFYLEFVKEIDNNTTEILKTEVKTIEFGDSFDVNTEITEEEISIIDTLIAQTNSAINRANAISEDLENKVATDYYRGATGEKGADAKINGKNAIEIEAGNNITIEDTEKGIKINSTGGGSGGTSNYNALTNKPKINNVELNGNKTSSDLGLQPAGNYALESEIPDVSNYITKDVNNLTNYTLKTNTGSLIDLEINDTTYVVTLKLKNLDGTIISADTIDLPLESVVVSGRYDNTTKKVILTLENGSEVDFSVADLVAGLQTEITSSNKLASDLVDDTNSGNKFVTTSEKQTWNNKYDKPNGGIPKADLASAVQTSLDKADTALQSHQDISGKANKISVVQTSASTIEINPNTFYKFGEVASLNITLASITDNTIYNEYMFEFVSGTTATTLTLPSSIKWLETPTIDANKIYQCSIVDNVGLLVGVTNV